MTDHQHTADVLNRAADLIEERGWAQGNWGTCEDAPLCLEGGILAALGQTFATTFLEEFWECPAYRAVADYLTLPYTREPYGNLLSDEALWSWNDTTTRTAAEVIEVLRATAVIEQARADEHTADAGYDSAAAMLSVAGDAAARTLAAIR